MACSRYHESDREQEEPVPSPDERDGTASKMQMQQPIEALCRGKRAAVGAGARSFRLLKFDSGTALPAGE